MRQECYIEVQKPQEAMCDISVLQGLLHARWSLGSTGSISLLPTDGGIQIVVLGTGEVEAVCHTAESIVRGALTGGGASRDSATGLTASNK